MEKVISELIKKDPLRMRLLQVHREFNLPDSWIAAGFVRNLVWDSFHEYDIPTPLNDIDVLYFNKSDLSAEKDRDIEGRLNAVVECNWSVKNQARMHLRNSHVPYKNTVDAMRYWPEIETAIGVRLSKLDAIELISPFPLGKVLACSVSFNSQCKHRELFHQRVEEKSWLNIWPKLVVNDN